MIVQAASRLNDNNSREGSGSILAKLIRADLGSVQLWDTAALSKGERFNAVSIQFALHYMFRRHVTGGPGWVWPACVVERYARQWLLLLAYGIFCRYVGCPATTVKILR